MKANEFVKKYGFNVAYKLRQGLFNLFENNLCILSGSVCRLSDNEPLFSLGELKRLVESHELVKSRGGLDAAKHELILLQKHLKNTFGYVTIITSEKIENLKQAIADVESCMEVSNESSN